ncbi:MAG: hypothetical protein KW806_00470 [Candidatus Yanofskybacteria bacterium]|nr:hypothetical protein [Candidatus Yanofskybacteria bacterium]
MTRRTRRILFAFAVIIFLGISYIAVVYAQGYKYSFTGHKFFRTGAISLRANADAKVFLDDKLVGSTSFLNNAFGVGSLLPGQYTIRLQRDGYTPWAKSVIVTEGYLVDFPKVIILPTNEDDMAKVTDEAKLLFAQLASAQATPIPSAVVVASPKTTPKTTPRTTPTVSPSPSASPTPTIPANQLFFVENQILYQVNNQTAIKVADNVLGFAVSENRQEVAWWNTKNEIRVMWLSDSDYQPFHKKGDSEVVTRFVTPIKRIAWFRGNDHLIVDANGFRIIEVDTRGGLNIIRL